MASLASAHKKFAMTVTSKGQVTLPAEYRQIVGIETGDKVELILDAAGEAALRPRHGRLADLRGAVPWRGDPIADDELEAMIARRRRAAGRKTSNLRALAESPPKDWSLERCEAYVDWARQVAASCLDLNADLDRAFQSAATAATDSIAARGAALPA